MKIQSFNSDSCIAQQISNSTDWSDDGTVMAVSLPSPQRHLPRQQGYRNLFEAKRPTMFTMGNDSFLRVSEILTVSP
jgi:hypothetical protein